MAKLFCLQCGYNLEGVQAAQCPECGEAFEPGELAAAIAEGRLRDGDGLWLLLFPGIVLALLVLLTGLILAETGFGLGGYLMPVGAVLGGACVAVFLGSIPGTIYIANRLMRRAMVSITLRHDDTQAVYTSPGRRAAIVAGYTICQWFLMVVVLLGGAVVAAMVA